MTGPMKLSVNKITNNDILFDRRYEVSQSVREASEDESANRERLHVIIGDLDEATDHDKLTKPLSKCPQIIFVPARLDVYHDVSLQIRNTLLEYTDLVEPLRWMRRIWM